MLTENEIKYEAQVFRKLMNNKKHDDIPCLLEDFPVMSCKLASLLFAYHILEKQHNEIIYGVGGFAKNTKGEQSISHYWLEINGIAVDLTADQYNIIDDGELNKTIIKNRPFEPIYIGEIGHIPQYKIFHIKYKDKYTYGLSTLSKEFIESLKLSHYKLLNN